MSHETDKSFKHLRVEGTKTALKVFFADSRIFDEEEIQEIGRELVSAAELASRIDMPLWLSLQGVEGISSALIGKLVLLNKKAKSTGVVLKIDDVAPAVRDVFRDTMGPGGPEAA